jgi:hypothetical protein
MKKTTLLSVLVAVLLSAFLFACGGGKEGENTENTDSTKIDSSANESSETKEEPKTDVKKSYSEYAVEGYKARGEAFEADEKQITIAFVPEGEGVIRDVEITANKLNDPAYLESEEAYKEYRKGMAAADNATITMQEKEGKKVFYYTFEDKMMGKTVLVSFLGKDNFEISFRASEKSKGAAKDITAITTEVDKFVDLAVKK